MKKVSVLLMAIAGCVALTACSDDDNNSADISGTYDLTGFFPPVAVDVNDDGAASDNLLNETTCYDPSQITLNNDGTFDSNYSFLTVQGNATTTTCQNLVTSGSWTQNGNTVALETTSGDIMLYTYSQNTLSQVQPAQYPNINSEGEAYLATGTVGIVFTKS